MPDILSQSEIDALLSAISTGEMDAEELKREELKKKEKVYDFKRALRFSKDQFRSLTRIHENFARLLTSYFSGELRTYVQITVASVDQLPYEEFVRSVPSMTILNVFDAAPLDGRMLIEVNPNVAYAMLDRVLGGVGTSFNKIDNLTEIESKLISQIFEGALDSFKEAWSTVIDIEPVMRDFEVNTQFLQMTSPNETVVVISLSMTVGEASGMMNVCIPHAVLEPIIQQLSIHEWMTDKKKKPEHVSLDRMTAHVEQVKVNVSAILGETRLTVRDLMDFEVGDVISLDRKIHEPLLLNIGPYAKFKVQPGRKNNHLAVQILAANKEGDEHREF
ncbi:flagellar motor switch protein FliM [Camelliibacillus cellulosilyticus]|uniref:Flagellar motor switch protein FliM n=1 Tax=Camelliibacillus cellulosilyticus TaxID=2174486 RepID=A0ABV9GJS6_9BACL